MNVNDFYIEAPSVLRPELMVSSTSGFPKVIIITFQDSAEDYFLSHFPIVRTYEIPGSRKTSVYVTDINDYEYGFLVSPTGGPASSILVEKASAMGCRHFIIFGPCGVIGEINPTSLFVPTMAFRGEGTSHYYIPSSNYIEVPNNNICSSLLRSSGFSVCRGNIWTTDALFRETTEAVSIRCSEGCKAVDMECASLSAVCIAKNLECMYFLYSADSLRDNIWERKRLGRINNKFYQKLFDAVIILAKYFSSVIIQTN